MIKEIKLFDVFFVHNSMIKKCRL